MPPSRPLHLIVIAATVVAIVAGCFRGPKHFYRATAKLDVAPNVTVDTGAETRLADVRRVAVAGPAACEDHGSRLATSGLPCGLLLGSIEQELAEAGFAVVGWRDAATPEDVDAVLHIREVAEAQPGDATKLSPISAERAPMPAASEMSPREPDWEPLSVDDQSAFDASCRAEMAKLVEQPIPGAKVIAELRLPGGDKPVLTFDRFVTVAGSKVLTVEYVQRVQTRDVLTGFIPGAPLIGGFAVGVMTFAGLFTSEPEPGPAAEEIEQDNRELEKSLYTISAIGIASGLLLKLFIPNRVQVDPEPADVLCRGSAPHFTFQHPRRQFAPRDDVTETRTLARSIVEALSRARWDAVAREEAAP